MGSWATLAEGRRPASRPAPGAGAGAPVDGVRGSAARSSPLLQQSAARPVGGSSHVASGGPRPTGLSGYTRQTMKKSWRTVALTVFALTVLVGSWAGDDLMALNDEVQSNVRLYTELIEVAHANYGEEIAYRDLVYASIQGMLRSLDPHTSFLSREAYESMRDKQQSHFYGLGIFVGQRNGQLTVITPIPGTPAAEKGMQTGDIISAIDGEPTEELSVDEAIRKLKGPKGTEVTVTLLRPGLDEPIDLVIQRAEIPQNTVQYAYMMTDEVGYLNIRDFSRSTGSEVARSLQSLKDQGLQKLILDLRFNGGGLLDQAIQVADQLVPGKSKIVETKGRIPSSFESYFSTGTYQALDMPLIVLVNGGSASASEILAGAVQDHDVGLVVGSPTWGKGLVQTVYSLSQGAGLALTTARYYTPSGRLIQRDYSSYWDYYTGYDENGGEPGNDDEDVEVFTTDLGRKVFGGGGITPDHKVEADELAPFLQKVLARSGFFTFIVEYGAGRDITESWQPDEQTLQAFGEFLVREEFGDQDEVAEALADPDVVDYARHRMRFEMFNGRFGLEAGHRALAVADNQIQAALALFDEAAALLEQRRAWKQDESGGEGAEHDRVAALR
ncbi:MAG: S41 family peptidase [Acidobacteria bacterium]|nr:MAG: S41 family peptidase [Acidobacteriota bacterium]